jgi:hypothetical protein
MRLHYFDIDGNYGNADKITLIGTSAWIREDFEMVRSCKDEDRYIVARIISEWVEDNRDNKKYKDEFERYEITPHDIVVPEPVLPDATEEVDLS